MPRYRFSWSQVPDPLLGALGAGLGLTGEPAPALRARYGRRPRPVFVVEAWPLLVEAWLVDDPEAWNWIVDHASGVHATADLRSLRAEQLHPALCEAALSRFEQLGEGESRVTPLALPIRDVPDTPTYGTQRTPPSEPLGDWAERVLREELGSVCHAVDGDLSVAWGSSMTWVRAEDGSCPSLHLYAALVTGVTPGMELYEAANRVNLQLPVAKAVIVGDGDAVVLTADLPVLTRSVPDLLFAVELVARAADHYGRALQERFGGTTSLDPEGGGDF